MAHRLSLSYDCIQLDLSRALEGFCLRGTLSLWPVEQVHRGGDVSVQNQEGKQYSNVSVGSAEKNDHVKQRSGAA